MTDLDLNDAPPQRELIPAGTIVVLQMLIKMSDGENNHLTRSKDGNSEALNCEFTIVNGDYIKRKVFQRLTMRGTTAGHADMGESNRGLLKAIIDSAFGLDPNDKSDAAQQKRRLDYGDFQNLRFVARLGIEKGTGGYEDKNKISAVITPGMGQYFAVEQLPKQASLSLGATTAPAVPASASGKPAEAIATPEWAKD